MSRKLLLVLCPLLAAGVTVVVITIATGQAIGHGGTGRTGDSAVHRGAPEHQMLQLSQIKPPPSIPFIRVPEGKLKVLLRPQDAADRRFVEAILPSLGTKVADYHLDLGDARLVVDNREGRAGVVPGPEITCFVAVTKFAGIGTTCIASSSARYGFANISSIKTRTLVVGLVPNTVRAVRYWFAGKPPVDLVPTDSGGYVHIFPVVPVKIRYVVSH